MAVTAEWLYARMAACPLESRNGRHAVEFPCMGTQNRLHFAAESSVRAAAYREAAMRWLAVFEARYSVFLEDSLIARINREAGGDWVEVDAETEQLFALCDWLQWKTRGALDPTMGPLLRLWDYHVPRTALPTPEEVAAARGLVGWSRVQRRAHAVHFEVEGMRLDLGGIGKEYAVDRLMALAEQHNITDILVDLGRDIRVKGQPPEGGPWRLGLEDPRSPGRCWGGVGMTDEALCCSGHYQRHLVIDGKRYGHIVDPRTGWPADNGCEAVWILAPTATEAGALSTAAMILGLDEALALIEGTYGAAGCIWQGEKRYQTRRFADHVLHDERIQA
jgi:thiamine biosynthesis lipoprotein